MLFNFTLAPLEKCATWGRPGTDERLLHWFGLTDGVYWMNVGDSKLFEYVATERLDWGSSNFCDYQVARLYEDVLQIAPYVLEAIPEPLTKHASPNVEDHWASKANEKLSDAVNKLTDDEYWQLLDSSQTWIGKRQLDTLYLQPSINVRMWSDATDVHIEWDNRTSTRAGRAVWTATVGAYVLPRDQFMDEVRSFHSRLMAQMSERVESVVNGALPQSISIDVSALQREHEVRSQSIERSLAPPPVATEWGAVSKAITVINQLAK